MGKAKEEITIPPIVMWSQCHSQLNVILQGVCDTPAEWCVTHYYDTKEKKS